MQNTKKNKDRDWNIFSHKIRTYIDHWTSSQCVERIERHACLAWLTDKNSQTHSITHQPTKYMVALVYVSRAISASCSTPGPHLFGPVGIWDFHPTINNIQFNISHWLKIRVIVVLMSEYSNWTWRVSLNQL